MNNLQIILASASPRRKDLLEQVGFKVLAIPSNISEDEPFGHDFQAHIRNMAIKKATKIARDYPDSLVLGADTSVICQNQPMGKPKDPEDAFAMLSRLSGTWHQVISGICLMHLSKKLEIVDHAITDVRFYPMTPQEIDEYIQSGEPYDKAGAYAIQGLGARYVQEIRGCFYNVVGLPLAILWQCVKPFPEVTR